MSARRKNTLTLVPMAAAVVACLASPAHAWGVEGHAAVAMLAEQHLSPEARVAIGQLLGRSLASVANWADEVKDTTRQDTYNWHFVNIPATADRYDPSRDCRPAPKGDCIVAALERLEQDLGNRSLSSDRRREALMFIVHMVGDLHQPLHTIDTGGDHGGALRRIEEIGGATSLHAAWDTGIIRASGQTAEDLLNNINRATFGVDQSAETSGGPRDWAMASFTLAKTIAYPQVAGDDRITTPEQGLAMSVIEDQIRLAGIRLAAVLNRALGGRDIRPPSTPSR